MRYWMGIVHFCCKFETKVLQLILIVLTILGMLSLNGFQKGVTGSVYALFIIMIVGILYVVRKKHLETAALVQAMSQQSPQEARETPTVLETQVGRIELRG